VTLEADLRAGLQRCQLVDRPRLRKTGAFPAFDGGATDVEDTTRCDFGVVYQPIVDLRSGRILGVEALARWLHPDRGPVSPQVFIPLAERSDAIFALGRWLLGVACRQVAMWNEWRGDDPLMLTVNLSGRQLDHAGLPAEMDAVLRETGLAPECLVLEITETVIMRNAELALTHLSELKRIGVRLAIDDFGTGYSSLSYLQRFPVDVVKIDRAFTQGLTDGGNGAALVRTIIALAGMLSLSTIAEGVEEPGQRAELCELGCDAGQGYLFGRPAPAAMINGLLCVTPVDATAAPSRTV
jgi:EAL domain-containing protein (putative c-di-GMP-specific phosphodiesterase class I)